jgi:hypothetical protein
VAVVGTNNVYYHNYVFAGMPLSVFVCLTLERAGSSWYKQLMFLSIGACMLYICYTKILNQPYRILPLAQQTEKVTKGRLAGILLDSGSKERYERLSSVMDKHEFTPQNGLICLGKMQGLQYILGTSSPGGVMFSPTFRELYLKNITRDRNEYVKPFFVLADYRFADSLKVRSTYNWEKRFTQMLGMRWHHQIKWELRDSIPFETAPLGALYLYRSSK